MNREQRRRMSSGVVQGETTFDQIFEDFLDRLPESCPDCGVPRLSFQPVEQYLPNSMTFGFVCSRCDWSTALTFHL